MGVTHGKLAKYDKNPEVGSTLVSHEKLKAKFTAEKFDAEFIADPAVHTHTF